MLIATEGTPSIPGDSAVAVSGPAPLDFKAVASAGCAEVVADSMAEVEVVSTAGVAEDAASTAAVRLELPNSRYGSVLKKRIALS